MFINICRVASGDISFNSISHLYHVNITLAFHIGAVLLFFWHAPLGVLSAKRRHQSPEWTILSHISFFIWGEVIGFQPREA